MSGNIAFEKERERERNDLPDVERSQSYVLTIGKLKYIVQCTERENICHVYHYRKRERERTKEGKRQLSMSK